MIELDRTYKLMRSWAVCRPFISALPSLSSFSRHLLIQDSCQYRLSVGIVEACPPHGTTSHVEKYACAFWAIVIGGSWWLHVITPELVTRLTKGGNQ